MSAYRPMQHTCLRLLQLSQRPVCTLHADPLSVTAMAKVPTSSASPRRSEGPVRRTAVIVAQVLSLPRLPVRVGHTGW